MEEAYQAALEKVGGLDAAKPRALLDELQDEFPFLTLQARANNQNWDVVHAAPSLPGAAF